MSSVEDRARELLAEGYAADGWKNASELADSIPAETPTMRAIIAALSLSDEHDPMSVYEAYAKGVNAGMGGFLPADTESLLAEAVEVGTLCNLAAEDTLDAGMTATADALSKAALTITNLGRALAALREQPEARGVVDDAMVERAMNADAEEYGASIPASRVRRLLTAAQQPEDLKAWSLRMAEKEQDQYVIAGSHGIDDVPVQEGDGELPGMWSASDFTGSDPEERAQHRAMRTPPPSAPVGVERLQRYRAAANPDGTMQMHKDDSGIWVKLRDVEALAQQPAQATPGDAVDADFFRWLNEHPANIQTMADLLRADQYVNLRRACEAIVPNDRRLSATPPGDDAAGGGHG